MTALTRSLERLTHMGLSRRTRTAPGAGVAGLASPDARGVGVSRERTGAADPTQCCHRHVHAAGRWGSVHPQFSNTSCEAASARPRNDRHLRADAAVHIGHIS